MSAHPLGEAIATYQDDLGEVCVRQRDNLRYLTFGNQVEQSVIDLAAPYRLEHAYTQSMLLGLLMNPHANRILLLGLGGGSLVHALHQARPTLRIDAVEYRQAVIDAAIAHFLLEPDRHLGLHCAEAADFVASTDRHYDLILVDLYQADGAHPSQTQAAFLRDCQRCLRPGGILLSNHWCSEFRDSQSTHQLMSGLFDERVLYLHVQGGNTIAFGFMDNLPDLQRDSWFEQAQQLGLKLNIPLQRLARNFWRQNAEPLQVGRFLRRG